MQKTMKRFFRLTIVFAMPLTISWAYSQTLTTITGNWILVCYSDIVAGTEECESEFTQLAPILLEFNDNGQSGKIKGYTSSNRVYGDYKIFTNNKIKVESFGGTKKGETTSWSRQFCFDAFIIQHAL